MKLTCALTTLLVIAYLSNPSLHVAGAPVCQTNKTDVEILEAMGSLLPVKTHIEYDEILLRMTPDAKMKMREVFCSTNELEEAKNEVWQGLMYSEREARGSKLFSIYPFIDIFRYVPKRRKLRGAELDEIKDLAELGNLPYCGTNQQLLDLSCGRCESSKDSTRVLHVMENEASRAVIMHRPQKSELVLAFRGSQSAKDWWLDAQFLPVPFFDASVRKTQRHRMSVHTGFQKAYLLYRDRLVAMLREELKDTKAATLVITGHSLGAAIATMAAADLPKQLKLSRDRARLVTFASPRVGNYAFAMHVDEQVGRINRVVEGHDVVSRLPMAGPGFQHVRGETYVFRGDAYQCEDAMGEDIDCQRSNGIPWPDDHTKFFSSQFFGSTTCAKRVHVP